jgi:hypothetical protein
MTDDRKRRAREAQKLFRQLLLKAEEPIRITEAEWNVLRPGNSTSRRS